MGCASSRTSKNTDDSQASEPSLKRKEELDNGSHVEPRRRQDTFLGIDLIPCGSCSISGYGGPRIAMEINNLQGTCRWCGIIYSGLKQFGVFDGLDSEIERLELFARFRLFDDDSFQELNIEWSVPAPGDRYFEGNFYIFPDRLDHCRLSEGWPPRRVTLDAMSLEGMRVASEWLHQCLHKHPRCSLEAKPSYIPKRLVDLGQPGDMPRLIEDPIAEPNTGTAPYYVALSYCWGSSPQLLTTKDNMEAHKQHIPLSSMPLTLQHAIHVTRQLNYRYLWVDALCIIQDHASDWDEQAAQMQHIYEGAVLTIAADVGNDSASGLSSQEKRSWFQRKRIPGEELIVASKTRSEYIKEAPLHRPDITSVQAKGFDTKLRNGNSFLQARAWAFQERVLSKRVLHFGEFEMGWECAICTRCECGEQSTTRPQRGLTSEDWLSPNFWTRTPIHLHEGDGTQVVQDVQIGNNGLSCNSSSGIGDVFSSQWKQAINDYSKRALTVPTDRLPALSGLASRAASTYSTTYLAGLWREDLELGLLWYRECWSGTRPEEYIAPSWSWASLDAEVKWPGNPWLKEDITIKITDVSCTPLTAANLHGAVKDGRIQAWALTMPVSVTPGRIEGLTSRRGYKCWYRLVADVSDWREFESDQDYMIVQVCFRADHDDYVVFTEAGLVVRKSRDVLDAWERVGFYYQRQEWHPSNVAPQDSDPGEDDIEEDEYGKDRHGYDLFGYGKSGDDKSVPKWTLRNIMLV